MPFIFCFDITFTTTHHHTTRAKVDYFIWKSITRNVITDYQVLGKISFTYKKYFILKYVFLYNPPRGFPQASIISLSTNLMYFIVNQLLIACRVFKWVMSVYDTMTFVLLVSYRCRLRDRTFSNNIERETVIVE